MQHAAIAALRSHEYGLMAKLATSKRRRDPAVAILRAGGVRTDSPLATTYLWLAASDNENSDSFTRRLLHEKGVAVLPGTALGRGGGDHVRLALTQSEDRVREAASRLAELY